MNDIEKNLKRMNRIIVFWVVIMISLLALLLKILF